MKFDLKPILGKAQDDLQPMIPAMLDFLTAAGLFTCHTGPLDTAPDTFTVEGAYQPMHFYSGSNLDGLKANVDPDDRFDLLIGNYSEGEGLLYRLKLRDTNTCLTFVGAGLVLDNERLINQRTSERTPPVRGRFPLSLERAEVWNSRQLSSLSVHADNLDDSDWLHAGYIATPDVDYIAGVNALACEDSGRQLQVCVLLKGSRSGYIAYDRHTGLPLVFSWYDQHRHIGGYVHQSILPLVRGLSDLTVPFAYGLKSSKRKEQV